MTIRKASELSDLEQRINRYADKVQLALVLDLRYVCLNGYAKHRADVIDCMSRRFKMPRFRALKKSKATSRFFLKPSMQKDVIVIKATAPLNFTSL